MRTNKRSNGLLFSVNDPPTEIGEIALLKACLWRAYRDAAGGRTDIRARHKREATAWFFSPSTEPFSFLWIAQHLDRCPRRIRATIKR